MEIAIGIFFLAVIGGALLLFLGVILFILWRRKKNR
jgi:cbb3-type cytochrome oxidase subunit 3